MQPVAARSRLRFMLRAGLPLLLIGLLAGCGMIPPEPKTDAAKSVFTLYNVVFAMGVAVFLGVEGFIVYSVFRYRRRDDRLPPQTHGNTLVEIIWTAIPTVIVLILFILSISTLATVEAKSDPSQEGVSIEVDGFQWQWQFRYQDGDQNPDNDVSVIGDQANPPVMVVPVGEPIRLTLVSRDVIHSFFVPQFLIKRDLIPEPEGQDVNHLEFVVSEPGTYGGQCAEFCGDFHAKMTFSVQGVSRADYETWLADAKAGRTPQPSAQPGGQQLELTAANIAFDKTELRAKANQPITLKFTNTEAVPHNVVIIDASNKQLFKTDDLTGPNASGEFNVPALPAGEYTFFCSFHPTQMVGKLIIE
ncbi:MAG TPA: cytochrome c oxidase subunit II [Candidatus Limnocylindria bacterium]|nr:cytochrome c oxidase subunit II [Candidatus Limnocylindria bacterium]